MHAISPSSYIYVNDLPFPDFVIKNYEKRGIKKLHEWQSDCLSSTKVLQGGNLVYSAPTSGGKTLISEFAIFQCLHTRRKASIFILPYVSIVDEKERYFKELCHDSGYTIRGFHHGSSDSINDLFDVAICTFEKANTLIDVLVRSDVLIDKVGLVVVDELHMVGEEGRGYLLECILTKVRFLSQRLSSHQTEGIQIIGMSATLPNISDISKWLNAQLYETNYRPIALQQHYVVDCKVYRRPHGHTSISTLWECETLEIEECMQRISDTSKKLIRRKKMEDRLNVLFAITWDVMIQGESVLVFCATKKLCEEVAVVLSEAVETATKFRDSIERSHLLHELKATNFGLDPILEKCIPFGIAFHHSGLTIDEKRIIERAYREGIINVIVATSTLAAGVNLPARRVIFHTPYIANSLLDSVRYHQMAGRAGRSGQGVVGESYVLCTPSEERSIRHIMTAPLPPLRSSLMEEKLGMRRLLLEVLYCCDKRGVGASNGLIQIFECTLLFVQTRSVCTEVEIGDAKSRYCEIYEAMQFLLHHGQVRYNQETDSYEVTKIGGAIAASGMTPFDGYIVYKEIERSIHPLSLEGDLSLLYLIAPLNSPLKVDWNLLHKMIAKLEPNGVRALQCLEIDLDFIATAAAFQQHPKRQRNEMAGDDLQRYHRLYTAFLLLALLREYSMELICSKFGLNRGALQSLQQTTSAFARMVATLCEKLEYWVLSCFIRNIEQRVQHGVPYELLPLMEIPGMTSRTARCLFSSCGCHTPLQLTKSSIQQVSRSLMRTIFGDGEAERRRAAECYAEQLIAAAAVYTKHQTNSRRVGIIERLKY